MLSKEQGEKIAAATNAIRPDWSIAQVLAVLGDERIRTKRAYRDTAVAMTWIATDPDSRQPTRILADDGPWWKATRPLGEPSTSVWIELPAPSDCEICNRPADWRHVDHVYQPRNSTGHGIRKPAELDELIAATTRELTTATEEDE